MKDLEKIARKEELCKANQDWNNIRTMEPYFIVPRKIELSYCKSCELKVIEDNIYYCLVKIKKYGE